MFEHQTSIIINRSPNDVFAFITDPANLLKWRVELSKCDNLSPELFALGKRWREYSNALGKVSINEAEIVAFEDGHSFTTKTTSQNIPFLATYTVEAIPEGTRLNFRVEANLPLALRLVEPLIRNNTETSIEKNFQQVKWALENS